LRQIEEDRAERDQRILTPGFSSRTDQ
jgi:hypothetical protein